MGMTVHMRLTLACILLAASVALPAQDRPAASEPSAPATSEPDRALAAGQDRRTTTTPVEEAILVKTEEPKAEEPAPEPALAIVPAATSISPKAPEARLWSVTVQTGFAETFQLTLGGMFGGGPAFQNKITISRANVFRRGDSLSVYGWNTMDSPTRNNDWQAGLMYKQKLLSLPKATWTVGGGLQRWRFPSVLTGAQDWLIAGTSLFQTKFKSVPITVSNESWSILTSPLIHGSLLHTQIFAQHPLVKRHAWQLALRHGPAHTYSWDFYGCKANRVFRYGGWLVLSWKNNTLEAGLRQQVGLQDRIKDNHFWSAMLTRNF